MNNNMFDNNDAINPSINDKKTQTFNLIIGVATLLIAIFGATFAYFTATARSGEGEVTVKSAMVSISFDRGTSIQAENLIPSTEKIALNKYQKPTHAYNSELDGEFVSQSYDDFVKGNIDQVGLLEKYGDRRCIDAKGKEVCYVFWFSVTSDGTVGEYTNILPYITVEQNEFENLSYLVFDVTYELDDETHEVLKDKYGIGVVAENGYHLVSDGFVDDGTQIPEDIVYGRFGNVEGVMEGDDLVGTSNPIACLNKEVTDASEKEKSDPSRCEVLSIPNQTTKYFEVVIWLEETGEVQDEQGKTFKGTVSVEVSGNASGEGYDAGHITGQD